MEDNTKKKKSRLILILLGLVIIAAVGAVFFILNNKEEVYRVIKVEEADGMSLVRRAESDEFEAYVDLLLKNDDVVETKSDGRLYLSLDDDKHVSVEPETIFKLSASGSVDNKDTRTHIVLEKGIINNIIEEPLGENESYEVETPAVTMAVRGTEFMVLANTDDGNSSTIEVNKGKVELYRPGDDASGSVSVDAGYMLIVKESDEELSSLVPWPIGEEAPSSDVEEIEDETLYVEFSFRPEEFKLDGESISPNALENFKARYDCTRESSDDGWHYYWGTNAGVSDHNGSIDFSIGSIDGGYWSVGHVKSDTREISFTGDIEVGADVLAHLESPIALGISEEELKDIIHYDEIMAAGGRFKCNWSDAEYMMSYFGEHGNQYSIYAPSLTELPNRVHFTCEEGKLKYWTVSTHY